MKCLKIGVIPEAKANIKPPMDIIGAVLLIVMLSGLIYGMIHGEQVSWESVWTWVPLAVFVITLSLLIIFENRQAKPLLDVLFFKKSLFILSAFTLGRYSF